VIGLAGSSLAEATPLSLGWQQFCIVRRQAHPMSLRPAYIHHSIKNGARAPANLPARQGGSPFRPMRPDPGQRRSDTCPAFVPPRATASRASAAPAATGIRKASQPGSRLADLGVYGFDRHEMRILASLVTEDPLLLVGRSGTGSISRQKRPARACGSDAARSRCPDARAPLRPTVWFVRLSPFQFRMGSVIGCQRATPNSQRPIDDRMGG
jgi:hypothetical protein